MSIATQQELDELLRKISALIKPILKEHEVAAVLHIVAPGSDDLQKNNLSNSMIHLEHAKGCVRPHPTDADKMGLFLQKNHYESNEEWFGAILRTHLEMNALQTAMIKTSKRLSDLEKQLPTEPMVTAMATAMAEARRDNPQRE